MDVNDKWFVCIKAIPQKGGGIMPLIAEDEPVTLNKIKAYCKDELTVDFFAEHFRPAKDNEIPIVLTDFERMLDATAYALQNSKDSERKQTIRKHSDILIKLARKEIEKKPERNNTTESRAAFIPRLKPRAFPLQYRNYLPRPRSVAVVWVNLRWFVRWYLVAHVWRVGVHVVDVAVENGAALALGATVVFIVDGLAAVLLGELADEGRSCRDAEQIRIDIVPPLVGGAAACDDGGVDGQGGAADQ